MNEETNKKIIEGLKNNDTYILDYNKYTSIKETVKNKEYNVILYTYNTSYLDNTDYKFYGIKKDNEIITKKIFNEIQTETINALQKDFINNIKNNYNSIKEKEKDVFNELIKNDSFKKEILYDYNFTNLYILNNTLEDFKNALLEKNSFMLKDITIGSQDDYLLYIDNELEYKNMLKNKFYDNKRINNWNVKYTYFKYTEINMDYTINNMVSLTLNKIDYIIDSYKKYIEDNKKELDYKKELYNKCKNFLEKNNNKSFKITLNNNDVFTFNDFNLFTNRLAAGDNKIMLYCFSTEKQRQELKKYNESFNNDRYDDDLHIKDIKKITFKNNVIYEVEA